MSTSAGIPCMWMRGGTSKGGYFLAEDLPVAIAERDAFLLAVMGSPDPRQIDGIGGADPLTSKVAVVRKSARANVDVDYLFLQVFVDRAIVSDAQACGNILAGVFHEDAHVGRVAARLDQAALDGERADAGKDVAAVLRVGDDRPVDEDLQEQIVDVDPVALRLLHHGDL